MKVLTFPSDCVQDELTVKLTLEALKVEGTGQSEFLERTCEPLRASIAGWLAGERDATSSWSAA